MAKVLIIGAGGVARVTALKCAQHGDVFDEIIIASRTQSKCDSIAKDMSNVKVFTEKVDADIVPDLVKLFNKYRPDLVLNLALPYQDLSIMDACLETKTNYLDTANYEPLDEAKFEYKWQWDYHNRFKKKGIMALLGCGFDPGVTNVFTAHAAKHQFDEITDLDIVDCNAGDHGHPFATNFNPEINIREITQRGKYYSQGKWIETNPHEYKMDLTYPEIGKKTSYLIYHEELESLVKNFPTLRSARFWMTFSEQYLTHLKVIQNIGMANINPIDFEGKEIVPLRFLKAVLPNPGDLGQNYSGQTSIGCRIRGIKSGLEKSYYVYNNCSHQSAYQETSSQAVSYTTGVPAMIGAMLMATGKWKNNGVFNVEEFDPDPFMEQLNKCGLPWNEKINIDLEVSEIMAHS